MVTHDDAVKRQQVADLVRGHRERAGLNVVEASRAAKVSRTTWTDIEQAVPPMKKAATLGKVAKVINIDTNVLFAAAGYIAGDDVTRPAGTDPTPAEVMALIRRLDERLDAVESQLGLSAPARSGPSDRTTP